MRYYFAPLEGITDSFFRRIHHTYFPQGVERYYTPFFSPTVHRALTPREARELPPAQLLDVTVIPQLLTKVPEDFLWMAQQCKDLGYTEVNLNLGCPSGTVTAKGKGSGMLRDLDALDRFLDAIYNQAPLPISVKTRIGFENPEEFVPLMEIFNRYPIRELTIHPRVRTAFYKGSISMEAFDYAAKNSRNPLCFNGDLVRLSQIEDLQARYPMLEAVMLGRGLIADPGMLTPEGTTPQALENYLNTLMETYIEAFGSARNTMFRMKEHWSMLIRKFDDAEKLGKRLKKTTDLDEYRSITAQIIHTLPMRKELPDW